MLLIGGVPVDGHAAQEEDQPTTIGGKPLDPTGVTPVPKPATTTGGASGVPTLPTPQDTAATPSGDGGQTAPTDGGLDSSTPFIVPPPTLSVPGLDTTGAATAGQGIDETTPRTTMMAAPTGAAQDAGTPSSGIQSILSAANAPASDGGFTQAPTPPTPDSFGSVPQSLIAQALGSGSGAVNPDTGTAPPTTSANVTGIDPNDDLRDKMITPATDSLTEQSRQNMADAQSNLSSFDPSAAITDAMKTFGANPSLTAPINPGTDVSGLLGQANTSTMNDLSKVNSADRQGLADQLSSSYLDKLGNTDVTAQPAVDPGKDVSGLLDQADAGTMSDLSKLNATDRQTLANQLFSTYQNELGPTAVQAGGAISTDPSDRLKALQDQVDQATTGLNSVDRVALAKQMYDTFEQSTDPQYQLLMRQATQKAAATGGLGSGGLRTSYGDLTNQRAQDLTTKQNELIQQAVSDSVNDALNKQSRLASLESQLSGEEAGVRGEQRTDRQYATDVDTGNVNRGLAANESAAGLAGQNADSDLSAIEQALNSSRGVSSDLAGRQQQRTTNQMANRDYQTGVDTGNVNRDLGARQTALTMGSSNANDDLSAMDQALAASRGVGSDLAGQQQQYVNNQQANQATALNQFNNDRNFGSTVANQQEGDLTNALGGATSVFNNTAAQEANNRNELRTERTYETGQEESAFERALAQEQQQQAEQAQNFGEGNSLLNTASMGNPASTLANLGAQGGDLTSIISQLAAQMGRGSAAAGGSTQAGAGAIPGSAGSPSGNPDIDQIIASLSKLGVQSTPSGPSAPTTPAGQGIDTNTLEQLIASMSGGVT